MHEKNLLRSQFMSKKFSGIVDISVSFVNFKMLLINNDDTSVIDSILKVHFPSKALIRWADWSKKYPGLYIDVGAHTGIFSLLAACANTENRTIAIEPLPINYYRMITNMRLNDLLSDRNFTLNMAASNKDEKVKFSILKERSLLSKGGKISDKGIDVKSIRLDSINFKGLEKNVSGLKIDTEGEDFKVLIGAENLIKKSSPNLIVEVRKDNFNEIKNFLSVLGYNHFYENELDLVHFERFGIMDLFASKF